MARVKSRRGQYRQLARAGGKRAAVAPAQQADSIARCPLTPHSQQRPQTLPYTPHYQAAPLSPTPSGGRKNCC